MTDSDTPLHDRKQFDKVLFTQSFIAKWTLITESYPKKSARIYSFKLLQCREMAEIEDLHPNLATRLSAFTVKIGHQNLLFSIGFIGFHHNSSLICNFTEIISFYGKFI